MAKTIKLTVEEFNFVLKYLPAFGTLNDTEAALYVQLISKKSELRTSYFWLNTSYVEANRVTCIRFLRGLLGYGLKEAMDLLKTTPKFDIALLKVTKEQVLAAATSYDVPHQYLKFE